jgi:hypothetical protein
MVGARRDNGMTNSGMMKSDSKHWWHRASLAGLLTVAMLAGAAITPAIAADDDDDEAIDTKFLRGMLQGLGLRRDGDGSGIDYRERSPLVVPPARTLPPPVEGSSAAKVAAWPTDPDVKRTKDLRAERKKPRKDIELESRPEMPNELNKQGGTGNRAGQTPVGNQHKDPEALSSQKELGTKNIFTWGALWGRNNQEYATFTAEPPRSSLTEPPAGYRTPSPAQPYGVGPEKWLPGAINPMDTPAMRGQQ